MPIKHTLTIRNTLSVTERPYYKYRALDLGQCESHTASTLIALVDWMAKNRMNFLSFPIDNSAGEGLIGWDDFREAFYPELQKRGIILEVGAHGCYSTFLPRTVYEPIHPDWFAAEDEPVSNGQKPPANIFHITNQDALHTFITNGLKYLKDRPEIDILSLWPPDGAKWPVSDIWATGGVPNAPAAVLKPFKDQMSGSVKLSGLSYSYYSDPPSAPYMYDADTIIKFAPYDRSYQVPIYDASDLKNAYYVGLINTWRGQGFAGQVFIYEYYRKYSWHSLPVSLIQLLSQEVPYYSHSAQGISHYCEAADWVTYELVHLFFAHLLWDKNKININNYLNNYFNDRFGRATPQMANYFTEVEAAGRTLFDSPTGNYGDLTAVTAARNYFSQAKSSLQAGLSSLQAAPINKATIPRFLIGLLMKNIDYAIADTEISYYKLLRDTDQSNDAKIRTQHFVEDNRFAGIILQDNYSMKRYGSKVDLSWVLDQYATAFATSCQ